MKNVHAVLHRALRDAVRWGYVVRSVADAVEPPKASSPEMKVWTPEQLRAFLAEVRSDRLFAGWMLLATTGLRRGELLGLRWADVDLEVGTASPRRPRVFAGTEVHVSEPKTTKGRRLIALDPATVAALRAHKARQAEERLLVGPGYINSGLVLTMPDGAPVNPRTFSDRFKMHSRRAGLPPIRLHDVRHSYASAALAAGVPAKVISERLGHATIGITLDTYSHVLPGLDERAASIVADLILGQDNEPGAVNNP
ncbi:MAG TPA: site-specific integrase [Actinomycetes bacterium]|nr:site-specific integrase [Actinomycetes bacterium]